MNTLNIEKDKSIFCDKVDETDSLLRTIKTIANIKQYFKNPTEFSFVSADKYVVAKEIKNFYTKKVVP